MEIKVEEVKELPDGSAICEVTYDAEALQYLLQQGLVATLKEGIEQENKCLMNSIKNTPVRWLKKMLKRLGTNLSQKIDNLLLKLSIYTSNFGNTAEQIDPTFPIPQAGLTEKDSTMKSSSKPRRKKKSPGLQLKNLPSKKVKKSD